MSIREFEKSINRLEKIALINLGCSRNLVDGQTILGSLQTRGYKITDLDKAEAVIVNTCGFIGDAKQESIDAVLEAIDLKKKGKIKKVIVAGCLSERYKEELEKEFQGEVDAIIGVLDLEDAEFMNQVLLTPQHYAFLKICESCYNACTFCVIPKIKGKFISRSFESIIEEVKKLDSRKIVELNVIGQDTTSYGMDLYNKKRLPELLKGIADSTQAIAWIRLMYTFPSHVTDELLDVIANEPKICKYIDLPLQHVSSAVLKSMNRHSDYPSTVALIKKIRQTIPSAAIRSTFIVGFPGETDEDFEQLLDFLKEFRLERVGAFKYSAEEGTAAYHLPNQIPDDIAQQRFDRLMTVQKEISLSVQQLFIGRKLKVLIDEIQDSDKGFYIGRTEYDAPDVDGTVNVYSKKPLKTGDMVEVMINDATEYDLAGDVI